MSLTARHFPDSQFSSIFRLLDDYNDHITARNTGLTARSFTPKFDVRETPEAYYLDGELPGLTQKDIDLQFSDPHTLVVKGRIQREHTVKEGEPPHTGHRYWVTERSIGEFNRSFNFPTPVDQNRVKASLKNGVLTVEIPKATAPTAKKITIE
ncbi:hypothetical protein CNMCM5793_004439 [Aspergillus hiratsukae]|uniref:SHSP domain-containing protein n=1 Tax=Aspergillus hiratsukae TaxID=1194566 RepID=A0A8H6QGF0_9EURO|nr:hypothetical protein CNMCM5793_004439 [Aspergillus hiratsukae]KAF7172478.1 hypothetical protein CNMCM6106_006668 [Aspergillus hiratsukae]